MQKHFTQPDISFPCLFLTESLVITASHENVLHPGDILPGGRGGGAGYTLVLEGDHLLATPGRGSRAF